MMTTWCCDSKRTKTHIKTHTKTPAHRFTPASPVTRCHERAQRKRIRTQPLVHHGVEAGHCLVQAPGLGGGADQRVEGDGVGGGAGAATGMVPLHEAKGFVGAVGLR